MHATTQLRARTVEKITITVPQMKEKIDIDRVYIIRMLEHVEKIDLIKEAKTQNEAFGLIAEHFAKMSNQDFLRLTIVTAPAEKIKNWAQANRPKKRK